MVVSQRRELNKDLAYNTNLRLLNIKTIQIVKITDNAADISGKFPAPYPAGGIFLRNV